MNGVWAFEARAGDALGLKHGEKFQVAFHAGPWSVLRRLPEGVEPEEAKMIIAGGLEMMPVPEVLSVTQSTGRDGEVAFAFDDGALKKVLFRKGDIVFATSTLPDDRLGAFLVANGRIDRKMFGEATMVSEKENKKFGRVLVEKGVLTSRELYEAVRDQVEFIVMSLFTYTKGSFAFVAREIPAADNFKLPHQTSFYILEGVRMSDEIQAPLERVQKRDAIFRRAPNAATQQAGMDKDVLGLLDGRRTVGEVITASAWSEANTVLALARLLQNGIIERIGAPAAAADLPLEAVTQLSGPEQLAMNVSAFLLEVRAALVAAGADPMALDAYFDSVPSTYEEVFGGTRLKPDGSLDVDAIVRFVTRFTEELGTEVRGQAMEMVTEALGDLIEYANWTASESVPEDVSARLAQTARSLREGVT